jgi:hypothetical protein
MFIIYLRAENLMVGPFSSQSKAEEYIKYHYSTGYEPKVYQLLFPALDFEYKQSLGIK